MCKIKTLAFIPARGGSVRVPNKNIKLLGGKPLISYTIECAKRSKYINRIIVSTDDKDIARIAKRYGAEVPFVRPRRISGPGSKELEVFDHALHWLKRNEGYVPDIIVKLFATSPFRSAESVDRAIEMLLSDSRADSVRSVRLCSEHPYKMWTVKDGRLHHFIPVSQKPPQGHTLSYHLLPKVYIQNASIDVIRPSNILKKRSITGDRILPYIMDEVESMDINMPCDLICAEALVRVSRKKGKGNRR
jgi:CMP-N-acetylneuraminic acid synthetase